MKDELHKLEKKLMQLRPLSMPKALRAKCLDAIREEQNLPPIKSFPQMHQFIQIAAIILLALTLWNTYENWALANILNHTEKQRKITFHKNRFALSCLENTEPTAVIEDGPTYWQQRQNLQGHFK